MKNAFLLCLTLFFTLGTATSQSQSQAAPEVVPIKLKNGNYSLVKSGSMTPVSQEEFKDILYFKIPAWETGVQEFSLTKMDYLPNFELENPLLFEKFHPATGPYPVKLLDDSWGLYFPENNNVIRLNDYSRIRSYSLDGLAPVQSRVTSLWGFIDNLGELKIPCSYKSVFGFNEKYAIVESQTGTMIINERGMEVSVTKSISDVCIKYGLFRVKENGKFGYSDLRGKMVVPAIFDKAAPIYSAENVALIKVGQKSGNKTYYGVFDITGEELISINEKCHSIKLLPDLIITKKRLEFTVNRESLVQEEFTDYYNLSGIKLTTLNVRPGTEPYYEYGSKPIGLFSAKYDEYSNNTSPKWGLIDKFGKVQIPYKYFYTESFINGLARVGMMVQNQEKWNVINTRNEIQSASRPVANFSRGNYSNYQIIHTLQFRNGIFSDTNGNQYVEQ